MSELLLHLLVLSVFAESVTIGPFHVGRVLAVAAITAVCLAVAVSPGRRVLPRAVAWVPVAGMTTWVLLSFFWSDSYDFWLDSLLQLALALCYFGAYVILIESRDQVRRLLVSYLVGATGAAILAIVQSGTGMRAVGLQGDPNLFAMYEAAALPIAIVLAGRTYGLRKLAFLCASGLLVWAVLAAESRGGLVTVCAVVLWLLWRGDLGGVAARYRGRTLLVGAASLGLLVVWAMSGIPRFQPAQVEQSGGSGRLDIWYVAWHAYQEHPVLGLGSGGFEAQSSALLQTTPGVTLSPGSPIVLSGIEVHNAYLEPLVELGPVGLVLYLVLLASAATAMARSRVPGRPNLLDACLPMLGAFAIATCFLSVMNNKLLWMLIGFSAVLPELPEHRQSSRLVTIGAERGE